MALKNICANKMFAFAALALAFQLFRYKLCACIFQD